MLGWHYPCRSIYCSQMRAPNLLQYSSVSMMTNSRGHNRGHNVSANSIVEDQTEPEAQIKLRLPIRTPQLAPAVTTDPRKRLCIYSCSLRQSTKSEEQKLVTRTCTRQLTNHLIEMILAAAVPSTSHLYCHCTLMNSYKMSKSLQQWLKTEVQRPYVICGNQFLHVHCARTIFSMVVHTDSDVNNSGIMRFTARPTPPSLEYRKMKLLVTQWKITFVDLLSTFQVTYH